VITASRLFAAVAFIVVLHAESPAIRMENGNFLVSPAPPPSSAWDTVLSVYSGPGDLPPMLGTYSVEAGALIFHPRYPIAQGVTYRAVLHIGSAPAIEKTFRAPAAPKQAPTAVSHVYPSADILPENTLKLYIEFSAPMSRGYAWQHIRLLDSTGSPIDLPFLEVEQELWDPSYRRLTVLFDPGRIKRGLVPNRDAGSPIEEGKQYTLVIDPSWPDANGNPLAREVRKSFRVGPAERTGIDLKQWRIEARKTLTVHFPRPLDYALLSHSIEVIAPGGGVIEGTAAIAQNETSWSFTPAVPWTPGAYKLQIDTALEDLAGNRIGRAFDVDVFDQGSERITRKSVELPFRIAGQ
jgi:hypothetical protein